MSDKHDADCRRRKIDFPYLCTCGLPDRGVIEVSHGANLHAPNAEIGRVVLGITLSAVEAGEAVTIDLETPAQAAERIPREEAGRD